MKLKAGRSAGSSEAGDAGGGCYRGSEIQGWGRSRSWRIRHSQSERLRAEFPLKTGAGFERDRVASGIEGLRKLYARSGYLDYVAIPETTPGSNATMDLSLTIEEGPQYRLDRVEFVGKKEMISRLQVQWKPAARRGVRRDLCGSLHRNKSGILAGGIWAKGCADCHGLSEGPGRSSVGGGSGGGCVAIAAAGCALRTKRR